MKSYIASATTKALLARMREFDPAAPGEDDAWKIKRTRASANQRSCGAWSWVLMLVDHRNASVAEQNWNGRIGGYYPASICGQAGATVTKNTWGDYTIDPPQGKQ